MIGMNTDLGRSLRLEAKSMSGQMLDLLEELVVRESPSSDKSALDHLGRFLADQLDDLGGCVEVASNPNGGDHLTARFEGAESFDQDLKPILVVGHFDTVWPMGTLDSMPFRLDRARNQANGPGILDMKAGITIFLFALRLLNRMDLRPNRPVLAFLNSDEETGTVGSRALLEQLAAQAEFALVVEPALADGGLKTARKGVGRYRARAEGLAAHSGLASDQGVSAILELANQIPKIQALSRPEVGTTVNIGVVQGGTAANVVPALATAKIDVRVWTMEEADRVDRAFKAMESLTPGATFTIEGRLNRPPMKRSAGIAQLFDKARRIGRSMGIQMTEGRVGGGSDANFIAALGVPVLDGLGAIGDGAHAVTEHIRIDSLPERAALLAAMLMEV